MEAIAERTGLDETYESATNTSDLTLRPERRGAADVLVAAGWSPGYAGGALLRLHSKWVSAKPRRFTEEHVVVHAATLPKRRDRPDVKRARTELLIAYRGAVRRAAERLPGRDKVVEHLQAWAIIRGLDVAMVGPALTHWLAPQCVVCDGHGKRKLPDAPVLGAACYHCNGTGKEASPLGSADISTYIADAVNQHRQGLKRRLRNTG